MMGRITMAQCDGCGKVFPMQERNWSLLAREIRVVGWLKTPQGDIFCRECVSVGKTDDRRDGHDAKKF